MHLGLIGGIGPAATDYYYRKLIAIAHERDFPLELTIAHADSPTLLANLASNDTASQVDIYMGLAHRLVRAGADVMAITSISGHFCFREFVKHSPLPLCDILKTVSDAVETAGYQRVGVLGTRGTMESQVFGGISSAEVVAPGGDALSRVHDAYVTIAQSGEADPESAATLLDAGRRLVMDDGVQAVLLGGTDLVLVMGGPEVDYPVLDCAGVHIDALALLAAEPRSE